MPHAIHRGQKLLDSPVAFRPPILLEFPPSEICRGEILRKATVEKSPTFSTFKKLNRSIHWSSDIPRRTWLGNISPACRWREKRAPAVFACMSPSTSCCAAVSPFFNITFLSSSALRALYYIVGSLHVYLELRRNPLLRTVLYIYTQYINIRIPDLCQEGLDRI